MCFPGWQKQNSGTRTLPFPSVLATQWGSQRRTKAGLGLQVEATALSMGQVIFTKLFWNLRDGHSICHTKSEKVNIPRLTFSIPPTEAQVKFRGNHSRFSVLADRLRQGWGELVPVQWRGRGRQKGGLKADSWPLQHSSQSLGWIFESPVQPQGCFFGGEKHYELVCWICSPLTLKTEFEEGDSSFRHESIQHTKYSARGRLWGKALAGAVIQLPESEHTGVSQVGVNVWGMNRDCKIEEGASEISSA